MLRPLILAAIAVTCMHVTVSAQEQTRNVTYGYPSHECNLYVRFMNPSNYYANVMMYPTNTWAAGTPALASGDGTNFYWTAYSSVITSSLDMAGFTITNMADGVELQDAVTVSQLQGVAGAWEIMINGDLTPRTVYQADYNWTTNALTDLIPTAAL